MALDSSARFQEELIDALDRCCTDRQARAELAAEMNELKPVYMREHYRSEQRRKQEKAEAVNEFMGQLFGVDPGR